MTKAATRVSISLQAALLGLIAAALLAGIVPAFKAYQTDVAENLVPIS